MVVGNFSDRIYICQVNIVGKKKKSSCSKFYPQFQTFRPSQIDLEVSDISCKDPVKTGRHVLSQERLGKKSLFQWFAPSSPSVLVHKTHPKCALHSETLRTEVSFRVSGSSLSACQSRVKTLEGCPGSHTISLFLSTGILRLASRVPILGRRSAKAVEAMRCCLHQPELRSRDLGSVWGPPAMGCRTWASAPPRG